MRALIRFFLRRHLLVNLITVGVAVLGLLALKDAKREGFPAVDLNVISVTARLPGASASDIEAKVVAPIEDAIATVDGVDEFTSRVENNLAVTVINLYDDLSGEEASEVEADLRRAIDSINDFPADMREEPLVHRYNPGRIPVMEVALAGPSQILPAAALDLEQVLEAVRGVSEVAVVGVPDPEIRVLVDAARARQHGVALTDVITAMQRRHVQGTGGPIEGPDDRPQVVLRGEYRDAADVAQTVLMFLPDGRALRIGDVARVEEGRQDEGLRVHTGGEPGVSLVVRKRESADIIDTAAAIRAAVDATTLPPGVEASLVNDGSFLTRNRLSLMASNGLMGLALVVLTLFLFLTRRTAFWVAFGVPITLLGVVALLPHVGMTINLISVAGMVVVLGLLVDDAVVVAERIIFHQHRGLAPQDAAVEGASSMARPVIASALTTMLAFSPILQLRGTPGKIAWNIPAVIMLALAVSLLEAFVLLPSHMVGKGGEHAIPPKRRFVVALERRYRAGLERVLRRRYVMLGVFLAVFVITMGGIRPRMAFTLFPQDDSDALYLLLSLPPGTPIEQTEAVATSIERQIPGLVGEDLLEVTARIGHQEPGSLDREVGTAPHEAAISVLLKPLDRQRTSAEWGTYLDAHLAVPEGVDVVYEGRVIGPPMGRPVEVHIYSDDDGERRRAAVRLMDELRAIPGVIEIDVDEDPGARQLDLRPDWDKLALLGLDAELVNLNIKAALYGVPVAEQRRGRDSLRYTVRLDPASRASVDALLDLPLRGRRGQTALLRDVVQPASLPSVATIHHRNGRRVATVTAAFAPGSGHTANSMGVRLNEEILPALQSDSVRAALGGEAVETAETLGNLITVLGTAVPGITLVIAVMLGSLLDALFVVLVIPFGVVGVILAFFVHGMPLSLFAMLGGIGLAGVVVNTSIVMVDAAKQRMAEAPPQERQQVMVDAVVERLRPILVTTLSTLGGVLPTAYGLGGYDAMLSPMSLAMGWGLAFSTVVTLFLVPALFATAQDLRSLADRLRR